MLQRKMITNKRKPECRLSAKPAEVRRIHLLLGRLIRQTAAPDVGGFVVGLPSLGELLRIRLGERFEVAEAGHVAPFSGFVIRVKPEPGGPKVAA